MKRILVVGGTGIISTPMSRMFMDDGVELWHFNRGQSGPKAPLPGEPHQITGDRKNHPAFEAQVREAPPFDCVIDMIGFAPEESESLVRACRGRAKHVIFCSTVDVYAKPAARYPITEDEPRRGSNDYGRNKILCEDVMRAAHQRGDFPVTIIRPGHTYGDGGGIIHSVLGNRSYIDRVRKGKPIVVHGDGTSLWTSCHAEDVARAFVNAAANPGTFGKAYHVPGEEWLTWNAYHDKLADVLGVPPPRKVYIPSDILAQVAPKRSILCIENFYLHNIFDNRRAHEDLGFRYSIPFAEGMRRTVTWFDDNGRVEDSDLDTSYDALISAWDDLRAALDLRLASLSDLRDI